MIEKRVTTFCKSVAYLIPFLLFTSCNLRSIEEAKTNNPEIMVGSNERDGSETRVKSISSYDYHRYKEELVLTKKGNFEYGNANDTIEYTTYKGDAIHENYILEYDNGLLKNRFQNFMGDKSKNSYEYNQDGAIVKHTITGENYVSENFNTYKDKKLISQKDYYISESKERSEGHEKRYVHDSIPNKIFKIYQSDPYVEVIVYTLNSNGKIILKEKKHQHKSIAYKEYKVQYEADTLVRIIESYPADNLAYDIKPIVTTIHYNANGLVGKVIHDRRSDKIVRTTKYSYDENDNLKEVLSEELGSEIPQYDKVVYGPYTVMQNFVFVPENLDFYIDRKGSMIDRYIDEQKYDFASNNKQRILESFPCPAYFAIYDSKDGVNWRAFHRSDYEYETVKRSK